jgi:WD40 repeat protein
MIQVSKLSYEEPNYPHRTGGDVTIIQSNPCKPLVAVGYTNGIIRIYNYLNQNLVATLKGHRSMVASLRFHGDGVTLASGGADCDIVIWDLVSYTATARLRGHKDSVTGLVFLLAPGREGVGHVQYIASVSKDTLLKVVHEA